MLVTTLFLKILKECSTAGGKVLDNNCSNVNLLLVLIIIYISMHFWTNILNILATGPNFSCSNSKESNLKNVRPDIGLAEFLPENAAKKTKDADLFQLWYFLFKYVQATFRFFWAYSEVKHISMPFFK